MAFNERDAEEATDPGEPIVPSADEETEPDFPEAQILVDEETGKHFLAFEIDPDSLQDEGGEGGEGKEE